MENRLDYVKQKLKTYKIAELDDLAMQTKMSVNTIKGLRYKNSDPRNSTLELLYNYFKAKE